MVVYSNNKGGKKFMDNKMTEQEQAIIKKLFDIRHEIEQVNRNAEDSYHKKPYVSDSEVVKIFKPLFEKHNLFFTRTRQWNVEKDMYEVTMTYYDLENGGKLSFTDDVPISSRNTQGYGALTTYLTRYFNLELFFVETVIDSSYETQSPVTAKTQDKPASNPFTDRLKKKEDK